MSRDHAWLQQPYIRLDDETYELVRKSAEMGGYLGRTASGEERLVTFDEYHLAHSHGRLGPFRSSEADDGWVSDHPVCGKSTTKYEFRLYCVRMVEQLRDLPWEERRSEMMADPRMSRFGIMPSMDFPSVRTLQLWTKNFNEHAEAALLPRTHLCGNRAARHSRDFEEIVFDLAGKDFLCREHFTISHLATQSKFQYLKRCTENGVEPLPHGRKVVQSIIDTIPYQDVVKGRLGAKRASRSLLQARRLIRPQTPMERVELDCTPADIFCVNEWGEVIGKPTICAAIDTASGVILGLQIQLAEANSLLVAKTIREIMTPKEDAFYQDFDIEHGFPCFGKPLVVITDQGSENSGDIIEACVKVAGFELRKNLPGHPEKKPFIERFLKDINYDLHTYPGATQVRGGGGKPRTAEAMKEARITVPQLTRILQKWRYDVYSQRLRRRVFASFEPGHSPAECWAYFRKTDMIPKGPTEDEMRRMFMKKTTRKLQHYGIEVNGTQYNSDQLGTYALRHGPGELDILYDLTNVKYISVYDKWSGRYFNVPNKDPNMPPLTVEELARARKIGEDAKKRDLAARALHVSMASGEHDKKPQKKTKLRQAKDEAKLLEAASDMLARAMTEPSYNDDTLIEPVAPDPLPTPLDLPTVTPRVPR